jgi:hypothetical protein
VKRETVTGHGWPRNESDKAGIAQLGEPAKAEAQLRPGERRDRMSRPVKRESQLRAMDGHEMNQTRPV